MTGAVPDETIARIVACHADTEVLARELVRAAQTAPERGTDNVVVVVHRVGGDGI